MPPDYYMTLWHEYWTFFFFFLVNWSTSNYEENIKDKAMRPISVPPPQTSVQGSDETQTTFHATCGPLGNWVIVGYLGL